MNNNIKFEDKSHCDGTPESTETQEEKKEEPKQPKKPQRKLLIVFFILMGLILTGGGSIWLVHGIQNSEAFYLILGILVTLVGLKAWKYGILFMIAD